MRTSHSCAIPAEMANDSERDPQDAGGMDEKAIRRAALLTLRRAILTRFPPGHERRAWLRWLTARTRQGRSRTAHRDRNVN